MMRWLTTSSIQARFLIVAAASALLFIGVAQLQKAPLGVYPEFSPVYVEVQTEAAGLSADEVEQLLTVSIEQDLLNGIAFMDEIWSQSIQGLSRVVCIFEPGTDPIQARQVVAERMTQAHALPNVSKPPIMLQPYSSTSRIMKVGLSVTNEELSLIDLSVLARWTIQPYLMGVEGVANVSIWGQRKRQLQVQVNPEVLRDKGVTLNEVVKTTGEALWVSPLSFLKSSTPGTGGFFDTPNQRLGVRHLLPISEPKDLANISVHGHGGLVLGDVANVVENHQPLIGDAIINGKPGLLLVVEKFPWANTTEVSTKVEKALNDLRPGLTGMALNTDVFQPAKYEVASKSNLQKAGGTALLFLVLFLFLFLPDWRTAFITSFSIVSAVVAASYVLYLNGTMLNLMVIAGLTLALGVIIDDTIITIENIRKKLGQPRQIIGIEKSNISLILEATLEMRRPVLFASFIILALLLPLFAFAGKTGAFVIPFASSYVVALLASLLVAATVTPALSALLFSKTNMQYMESPAISRIRKSFSPGIIRFAREPFIAYSLLAVMLIAGASLYLMLDKNGNAPALAKGDLLIQWEGKEGTSRAVMNRLTTQVIQELNTVSGVSNVVAHIGRAVMSDKTATINNGEIWVNIKDKADYNNTLTEIQHIVDGYPGLDRKVQNYHAQSIRESVALTNPDQAVRVYGENQQILESKAAEVKKAIASINGVENAKINHHFMEPTIEIEVDLEAARKHEIQPGTVRRTAAILLAGVEAGSLFEGQKVFDVMVWGTPEVRNSISSVKNLLINKPGGGHVRLGEVANVKVKRNLNVINRESVSRYMDVSFDLGSIGMTTIATDIEKALAGIDFPMEFHAELVGSYKKRATERSAVLSLLLAGFIGIFLLLQAAFWSWRLSLMVFFSLAMSLTGGLLLALLNGSQLGMGAMLGLIGVLGLATHHCIILINHFRNLELKKGQTFGLDLILRGVKERFAPIIISTILIAVVFLPFVFFGNIPGLEMLQPMSLTILGGLTTCILLNLFVIPTIYLQFGKMSDEVKEEEKAMSESDLIQAEIKTIQLQN